jgi:hypothetical protein
MKKLMLIAVLGFAATAARADDQKPDPKLGKVNSQKCEEIVTEVANTLKTTRPVVENEAPSSTGPTGGVKGQ